MSERGEGAMGCFLCGDTRELRVAPIMTGDRFDEPPRYAVCGDCLRSWHDPDYYEPVSWKNVRADSLAKRAARYAHGRMA